MSQAELKILILYILGVASLDYPGRGAQGEWKT